MKGLLIKDFYLNFLNKKTLLLYLIISFFMAFSMGGSFVIGYTAMLMGIMAISTLSYDELDNGYPFLFSLPVSRRTYVQEKFIYFFLLEILGGICGVIFFGLAALLKNEAVNIFAELPSVCGFILGTGIMMSLMIPIQLKYGVEKSRLTLMMIYGVIFALSYLLSKIPAAKTMLKQLLILLQRSSKPLIILIVLLLFLTILSACYFLSLKIMEKKEF